MSNFLKMESFGSTLRLARLKKKLTLKETAAGLNVDVALLSKIERGLRMATRIQVDQISTFFGLDEGELKVQWLSDLIVNKLEGEEEALKVLQLAESKVNYMLFSKIDKKELKNKLTEGLAKFSGIRKAWIYGSFSRGDDGPKSDIDVAIDADDTISYFDLASIQLELENAVQRTVDVGFIDAFKPYIFEHVKPDLQLIYEKG
jgi:predicted nucleotidyltransferase